MSAQDTKRKAQVAAITRAGQLRLDRGEDPATVEQDIVNQINQLANDTPGGYAKGLARAAAGGVLFSYADELEGLLRGGGDATERIRREQADFKENNPYAATGAEIAGSLVPGIGFAKMAMRGTAAAKAGLEYGLAGAAARRAAAVAASGAGAGAIAGSGASTGGVVDRLPAAAIGAAAGGLFGYGMGKAFDKAGDWTSDISGYAKRRFGKASPVDAPPASARAARELGDKGLTADQLETAALSPDSPVSYAVDIMGQPGMDLARNVRTLGGAPSNIIDDAFVTRQAGQGKRIVSGVQKSVPKELASDVEDALIEQRRLAAAPLYEEFSALGVLDPTHPALKEMLELPLIRDAIKRAKGSLVRLRKLPDSHADVLDEAYKISGRRAFAAKHNFSPAETQRDFLAAIDAASGGKYSPALNAFAGPSVLKDALKNGEAAFGKETTAAIIRRTMKLMTEGERSMYRHGAVDGLRTRIRGISDSRDVTKLFNNDNFRDNVVEVFGDEAPRILRLLDTEGSMARVGGFVRGGSQTADKLVGATDLSSNTVGALRHLAQGDVMPAIGVGLQHLVRVPLRAAGESTRGGIARGLLTPLNDETRVAALVAALREYERRAALKYALKGTSGSIAGRFVSDRGPIR